MSEILGHCATCAHYRSMAPGRGMCRRFPPVWVERAGAHVFPATGSGDLCGEWRAATRNEVKHWDRGDGVEGAAPGPNLTGGKG